MVYDWLKFIHSAIYPPHCVLCGAPGTGGRDLCAGCLDALPRNHTACLRCGVPLSQGETLCGSCAKKPPPLEASHIPFRYSSPLDHLLLQLKFHQKLYLAPLLGGLLADALVKRREPMPDCLVPVPLHTERLRERGYNQALELARVVSNRLGVPVDATLCLRKRATAPQTALDGRERRRNLRGAFWVREGTTPQHIAIIDDVVTTGTTVNELARTLRRSGAQRVEVWACARAGR